MTREIWPKSPVETGYRVTQTIRILIRTDRAGDPYTVLGSFLAGLFISTAIIKENMGRFYDDLRSLEGEGKLSFQACEMRIEGSFDDLPPDE